MNKIKNYFKNWNLFEILFLIISISGAIVFAVLSNCWWIEWLTSITSLLFVLLIAKGKSEGYIFGFITTIFYCIVSFRYAYYGEIIISIFLTTPLNILGLMAWRKHFVKDTTNQKIVEIASVTKKEKIILFVSQAVLSVGYYFLLKAFNTEFLFISTLSVVTSLIGTYLLLRRCNLNWIFWIINASLLILLWGYIYYLNGFSSISMLWLCIMTFVNNIYGYINWLRLEKSQKNTTEKNN